MNLNVVPDFAVLFANLNYISLIPNALSRLCLLILTVGIVVNARKESANAIFAIRGILAVNEE